MTISSNGAVMFSAVWWPFNCLQVSQAMCKF